MLMIYTENSFFDIFFLFFFAGFAPPPPPPPPLPNGFGDENISFFSSGTFLTLCQIKIVRN